MAEAKRDYVPTAREAEVMAKIRAGALPGWAKGNPAGRFQVIDISRFGGGYVVVDRLSEVSPDEFKTSEEAIREALSKNVENPPMEAIDIAGLRLLSFAALHFVMCEGKETNH